MLGWCFVDSQKEKGSRQVMNKRTCSTALLYVLSFAGLASVAVAQPIQLPPGPQLFIDDYVIGELKGVRKVLNQPVKHADNPIMRQHKREHGVTYGSVLRDPRDGLFKLWYQI